MPPKPLVQNVPIEVITTIPGVQVTLDLKQAALIRDLLITTDLDEAKDITERDLISKTRELLVQVGGMDVRRNRRYLFSDGSRF